MNEKSFENILESAKFMVERTKKAHYIYKHKGTEDYFYTNHTVETNKSLKKDIYIGKVELQDDLLTFKEGN